VSDIAIVTCRTLPEPDPDEAPLLDACTEAGIDVEMAAWDDPAVDWGRYRLAIFHSCWNYYEDPDGFRAWIDKASSATALWNQPQTVLENLDKRYMAKLESQGVPIVPTRFLDRNTHLGDILEETGWERFVIKPKISAASYMTKRFCRGQEEEAGAFACEILATRGAMLQPYLDSVERGGEVAVVCVDGEFTHCVAKKPRFTGSDESVSVGFQPDEAQICAARVIMSTVREKSLYARIDLMQAATGEWLLSELELIEPTLFLLQHPPALRRFVGALGRL